MKYVRISFIFFVIFLALVGNSLASVDDGNKITMSKLTINGFYIDDISIVGRDGYYVIPVIRLFEELGMSIIAQENGDLSFMHRDVYYVISKELNTIIDSRTDWDVLQLPPGTNHLLIKEWNQEDFWVDSDTLRCFFATYLKIYLSVDRNGELRIWNSTTGIGIE